MSGGPTLRERALRHLARRDHSRQELTRKLAPHGTDEEITDLLERLHELGLISDGRFAESFLRSRANRFGQGRLRQELARRGVDRDTVDAALERTDMDAEESRARSLWDHKFGTAPGDSREWARQARFLQGRGFSADIIRKVLKDCHDEPA